MTADELAAVVECSLDALGDVTALDWSTAAGTLEWSCRQTVDHLADCTLSFALQIATGATSGFVPIEELRASPTATPMELVFLVGGVSRLLLAAVRASDPATTASDGVVELALGDWCARAAYELLLHTHDVLSGLERPFEPPAELCRSVLASDALWMLARGRAAAVASPWQALLEGSGRPAR